MLPNSFVSAPRTPRVNVLINQVPVAGCIDTQIISNNHYACDRFFLTLALDTDPAMGAAFWASQQDIAVEIQVSMDGIGFVSMLVGQIDLATIDPIAGTVRLEGRDLAAALIEARTQETFSNRTSSEIAVILAGRHGLTPIVTSTTTPVGRYYQDEHDRITLNQFSRATTEWDLLTFLADHEGFDVFVQGQNLYFQPPMALMSPVLVLQPPMLMQLQLQRSLTLARDMIVTVKSWNSRQQNAFTQTARATGPKTTGAKVGSPQRYVFVRPNLTPGDALKLAQKLLANLTMHERVVDLTMPGELTLTGQSTLLLDGTNTDFDQAYFVDAIERQITMSGGYVQRVRAKNTSPRTQSVIPADVVGSVTG